MANKNIKKAIGILFSIMLVLSGMVTYVRATTITVSDEAGLRNAIANKESDITLGASFSINDIIEIKGNDDYQLTIHGGGNKLTIGSNITTMFHINGDNKEINFDNIKLDGGNKGKLLRVVGSTINISNSTIENGLSYNPNAPNYETSNSEGGAIYASYGATIKLDSVTLDNNIGVTPNPKPREGMNGHGGAIYAIGVKLVEIKNSNINNNVAGVLSGGGVVYIEDSEQLTVSNSTLSGNHTDEIISNINQGGAFYVSNTNVTSSNNTYNIAKTFNTGGIFYLDAVSGNKKFVSTDDTYKMNKLGDALGISGGAIVSSHSDVTVDRGNFITEGQNKLIHAGGFIDFVGHNEVVIRNTNFTGLKDSSLATYGGAIAFEEGSTGNALIENTTFTNLKSDHTGGAISIGAKFGMDTPVNLTINNSSFTNNRAYYYMADSKTSSNPANTNAGGSIYVGPKATLTVNGTTFGGEGDLGDRIHAFSGGFIYNAGSTTISGGSVLNGGTASEAGGSIFNDGYLKLDDMQINDNWRAHFTGSIWWGGNPHPRKDKEYAGINVYAKKDVIITPNANITTAGDVHVIDGQSAVILTGTLNKQLNVSISEQAKDDPKYPENSYRHVGYKVAEGDGTYEPVPTDAQFIHYVTKDASQAVSEYNDHTSPAKWDYVFNPDMKTVVLGQRAKMVYHTNEATATIKDGVADNAPNGQKVEQLYTFYSSGGGEPKVSIDNKPATELTVIEDEPTLAGYTFRSWNTSTLKEKPNYNEIKIESLYDFVNSTFTKLWHKPDTTAEITTILNAEDENTLDTYAIYEKGLSVKVKKKWQAVNKTNVDIELHKTNEDGEDVLVDTKTIAQDNQDWIEFKGLSKLDSNGKDIKYFIVEKGYNEATGKTTLNNISYDTVVKDVTDTVENKEEETQYFEVTNKETFNMLIIKAWEGVSGDNPEIGRSDLDVSSYVNPTADVDNYITANNENLYLPSRPESVQVEIYNNGNKIDDTLTLSADNNWQVSVPLMLTDEDGNNIMADYTIKEVGENEGKITIGSNQFNVEYKDGFLDNQKVVHNKYIPETTEFTATKIWSGGPSEKPTITFVLQQNGVDYKGADAKKTLENGVTSVTWENLPKKSEDGQNYVYTVREEAVDGYTTTYNDVGNKVTNTYQVRNMNIAVNKTWVGKTGSQATVRLKSGDKIIETKVLDASNGFAHIFVVPETDNDGNKIAYTLEEEDVAGYTKKITGTQETGFIVENTYNPAKTNITAKKVWKNVPANLEKPEVTLVLQRNGQPFGDEKTLTSGMETVTWENIDIEDGNGIPYEFNVIEKDVPQGYQVSYEESNSVENGFTVINTNIEKTVVKGNKTWTGIDALADKDQLTTTIELSDGNSVVASANVSVANGAYSFENLPKYKNGALIEYRVKEKDEKSNYININNHMFKVTYSDNKSEEENTRIYDVANAYLPPITPLEPATTKIEVSKTWDNEEVKSESIQAELVKDGIKTGQKITLNDGNGWKGTFENLPVSEIITKDDGTKTDRLISYQVVEVGEKDGKVSYGKNLFAVSYIVDNNKVTIQNVYLPPSIPLTPAKVKIAVEKQWSNPEHVAKEVKVELLKNGVATGTILVLNEDTEFKGIFEGANVDENGNKIQYSVREVGEENGKVIIDGNEYEVVITGDMKDGFVVTNKYVQPKEDPKQPPKETEKPKKEKSTVSTGDSNNVVLISIVGVISLLVVLILALLGKKKKDQ